MEYYKNSKIIIIKKRNSNLISVILFWHSIYKITFKTLLEASQNTKNWKYPVNKFYLHSESKIFRIVSKNITILFCKLSAKPILNTPVKKRTKI